MMLLSGWNMSAEHDYCSKCTWHNPYSRVSLISLHMMKMHHHKILMATQISYYAAHNKRESLDGLKLLVRYDMSDEDESDSMFSTSKCCCIEAQQIPISPISPASKFFQMCFSSLERRAPFEPAARQKELSEGIMAVYMECVVRSCQAVPLSWFARVSEKRDFGRWIMDCQKSILRATLLRDSEPSGMRK